MSLKTLGELEIETGRYISYVFKNFEANTLKALAFMAMIKLAISGH
jgi:hypothetical protein